MSAPSSTRECYARRMAREQREWGRFARVITSDLVAYFVAPESPFARSERHVREFASHGLCLIRARYGDDDALERYYADCVGSAFESLRLPPPTLEALRASASPFVTREATEALE